MPINRIAHSSTEIDIENYIGILRAGQSVSDTGWSLYADSAGVNPVDGIGGTANITWSQNTTSPLSGEVDLRLVKDASNRQGQGVSIPFTIANRHLGKVLQITFDTELISGTFASSDLRVSIIQDPTGTPVVIEPVNTGIQLGITNQRIRHIASFQTHISITSYRLCIHVASTSASAYTVDFANFRVWEPTQSIGAVITDWQSYTPTGSWITNATYTGRWRRVGNNLEVRGRVTLTGATTAATLNINLPSGLSIDSSNLPSGNNIIGEANGVTGSGSNSVVANVFVAGTSSVSFSWVVSNGASPNPVGFGVLTNTSPLTFGNGDFIAFKYSVPIAGWGSSVAMSSDSGDGRVVIANYDNPANVTANNTTPVRFTTLVNDTHNAYDTTTGKFTAPISGYYSISLSYTHGVVNNSQVYINNVATAYIILNASSTSGQGSTVVYLNAGQTVDVRPDQTGTVATAQTTRRFSIFRISAGSQVITSQETVAAFYYSGATQTGLNGRINFGTRVYDTHGAVTTGTNWRFTAPMSGKYQISAIIIGGASEWIRLTKNDSGILIGSFIYCQATNFWGTGTTIIDLLAGEYIDLRPTSTSATIYGSALLTSANVSSINIVRVGN